MKKMRERRLDVVESVNQNVGRISTEEVRMAIKKMKNGKAVRPDEEMEMFGRKWQ